MAVNRNWLSMWNMLSVVTIENLYKLETVQLSVSSFLFCVFSCCEPVLTGEKNSGIGSHK